MGIPNVRELQGRLPQNVPPDQAKDRQDHSDILKWRGQVLDAAAELAEKADLRAGSHQRVGAAIRKLNQKP